MCTMGEKIGVWMLASFIALGLIESSSQQQLPLQQQQQQQQHQLQQQFGELEAALPRFEHALPTAESNLFARSNSSEFEFESKTRTMDTNLIDLARRFILDSDGNSLAAHANNLVKRVPYIRSSIPMRMYECISEHSMLRCTKLYLLQRMEEGKAVAQSGNLTRDFVSQFFGEAGREEQMGSLIEPKYNRMSDKELNQRLVLNFQRFFKHRDIKLHFLPGVTVKVVPSKENQLKFSIKKGITKHQHDQQISGRAAKTNEPDETIKIAEPEAELELDSSEGGSDIGTLKKGSHGHGSGGHQHKRKVKKPHSYKHAMLQMAVPVLVMPAILMGTFIPFLLPVLKLATFMTMMMNNSAFIAALIYAARTHVNSQDEQTISYAYQTHQPYY